MDRPKGHCSKEANAIFRKKTFELLKIFATVKDREYGKLGELRKQVSALMQATFETFFGSTPTDRADWPKLILCLSTEGSILLGTSLKLTRGESWIF